MIKEAIKKLVAGNDLTFDEAAQVMDEMFSGTATQSQMAAYLTALRIKGETIDEITASAQVMREKALHIKPNRDVLDISAQVATVQAHSIFQQQRHLLLPPQESPLQSTATVQCQAKAVQQTVLNSSESTSTSLPKRAKRFLTKQASALCLHRATIHQ